jgi:hypothetical protein
VYETHLQRVQEVLTANPGVTATKLKTNEDMIELQHRVHASKGAFRKSVGYVTRGELQRLGANSEDATEMKRAMDRNETNQ